MTNAAAVFEKAKKSVVVVRVFDSHGNQSVLGSGVITAENEVTTNLHVVQGVQDGSRVEVSQEGEEKAIVVEVSHIQFIVGRDLCLLSVEGLTQVAKIRAAKDLKEGESVFAIGAPLELEGTITSGIVSRLEAFGELPPLIQTDAAISAGSSGGGLFDGEGNLVGITTDSYEKGQNLNRAIPSEWIADARLNQSPFSKSAPQISAGSSLDFFDKVLELQEVEDWNGMVAHCKEWTKAEPGNPDALYGLGVAYSNINRYDDAITAYGKALRINPENAETWYNLGVAYYNLKRYDDAIAAYGKALQTKPEYVKALNNLGMAYSNLGRLDDAIAAYDKALRINPEFADAWYNLGSTYGNFGRPDDAIAAFLEALQINPKFAAAWKNLSTAYRQAGRNAEADEANQKHLRAKILSEK